MQSSEATSNRRDSRSTAQIFCLVIGATLVLMGLLGFLAEAKFDTASGGDPGPLDGENFIIFEVNGWHNVVHILSGLLLLAVAGKHRTAKAGALGFAAAYGIVTVIGLIDGQDVLGLFPVNPADNVLHILLTVAALAAGLASTHEERPARDTRVTTARTGRA